MLAQSAPKKDTPPALTPSVTPRMPWRVVGVQVLSNFRLRVQFVDGLEGEVDLKGLIDSSKAGVFAALADPDKFAQAYVEYGAVTWPGEIDLAPDAMHQAIKAHGVWVLS